MWVWVSAPLFSPCMTLSELRYLPEPPTAYKALSPLLATGKGPQSGGGLHILIVRQGRWQY